MQQKQCSEKHGVDHPIVAIPTVVPVTPVNDNVPTLPSSIVPSTSRKPSRKGDTPITPELLAKSGGMDGLWFRLEIEGIPHL